MNRWYTLVGYYLDNDQPIVARTKAPDPQQAAKLVIRSFERKGHEIYIVEAFEGRVEGCLGNDKTIS